MLPDVFTYSALISACKGGKHVELALKLFEAMKYTSVSFQNDNSNRGLVGPAETIENGGETIKKGAETIERTKRKKSFRKKFEKKFKKIFEQF